MKVYFSRANKLESSPGAKAPVHPSTSDVVVLGWSTHPDSK